MRPRGCVEIAVLCLLSGFSVIIMDLLSTHKTPRRSRVVSTSFSSVLAEELASSRREDASPDPLLPSLIVPAPFEESQQSPNPLRDWGLPPHHVGTEPLPHLNGGSSWSPRSCLKQHHPRRPELEVELLPPIEMEEKPLNRSVSFSKDPSDERGPLNRPDGGLEAQHVTLDAVYAPASDEQGEATASANENDTAPALWKLDAIRLLAWIPLVISIACIFIPWRLAHFCCRPFSDLPIELGLTYLKVPYSDARNDSYTADAMLFFDLPSSFKSWSVNDSIRALPPYIGVDYTRDLVKDAVSQGTAAFCILCTSNFLTLLAYFIICIHRSKFYGVVVIVAGMLHAVVCMSYALIFVGQRKSDSSILLNDSSSNYAAGFVLCACCSAGFFVAGMMFLVLLSKKGISQSPEGAMNSKCPNCVGCCPGCVGCCCSLCNLVACSDPKDDIDSEEGA